ncbi:unnamed protein product [Prunus brigantina]
MRNARDILLKPPVNKLEDHDLLLRDREMQIFLSKCGVDSASLTPLEVRLAEGKKARESSAQAKGSNAMPAANPKVGKFNPIGDAGVSDLLKMNFLSSLSTCAELVNHIRQGGYLDTFSSLSLEKQKDDISS